MSDRDDDGFVVPPPGISPQPTARETPAPEPVDEVDMISLPPGLVDSATYRVQAPRVQKLPETGRSPSPPIRATYRSQAVSAPAKPAPTFVPTAAPGMPVPAPVIES